MTMLELLIWLLVFGLGISGSATRTVAESVHDARPALWATQTSRLRWLEFVGSILEGGSLAGMPLVVLRAIGDFAVAVLAAMLSVALLLAAQVTARRWAKQNLERVGRPLLGDAVAFLPLVKPHPEPVEPEAREETLEQVVDASEKVGLIQSDEREMITGILQLDRALTREIMVPRMDVIALDVETPLQDALDVVIAGAHSRVPLYAETIDHVIGLLYAKDLLRTLRDGKTDISLRALLRPVHFVPEAKRLDELLEELQRTKVHMAIVVDEYGGTAGIVTIEDVLEEIVGEIQDEYDTGEEPLIERVSENEGIFNARVNIDEVNEALTVNLPNESDTLGGLVYQRLGKMPKVGDQIRVDTVTIVVLTVLGRRIKKVRVVKPVEEAEADPPNEERMNQ